MNFLNHRRSSDDDIDSISDAGGGNNSRSATAKSRKPPNTAFRQQRLKAWQPILTPKSVIPLLFVLAMIFTPLGIAILHTVYNVETLQVNYSACEELTANQAFTAIPSKFVTKHLSGNLDLKWKLVNDTTSGNGVFDPVTMEPNGLSNGLTCQVQFSLNKPIKPPIYLYYHLTNFYQNHRKYVESYDLGQLSGNDVGLNDLASKCKPLRGNDQGKIYYPAGLIANSFFNDTFLSPVLLNAQSLDNYEVYNMSSIGISWSLDRNHKYKNSTYDLDQIVPPPNWSKLFPNGYTRENFPDLSKWEHLQNWMRTAGLPNFYKLYSKNEHDTMSSGVYQIDIALNYPTSGFGGKKLLVITTNLIFGGRNLLLGVIYIIVAVICLVLGVAFLLQHLIKPRRIGDHTYLHGGNVRDAL